ncbi:membrane-associating domain-containing protein [Lipomyces japonicus]|uniref:membrane-associating domain-containing protein n=1 Tax=Lipomyces japonicus TaxID=56871 RepID=UPI0034CD4E58
MGYLFVSNIILRSLAFAFLVITLGLTGSLINGQAFGRPQVNFIMFTSVFGLLFGVLYQVLALFISALAFPIVLAALDFLNTVFTFSGATALAVAIRVHSCTNVQYLNSNSVAQGSTDRCRKAQADTAFTYFAFIVFLVALVLSISTGFREGWGNIPIRKRPARPGPSMSQVA